MQKIETKINLNILSTILSWCILTYIFCFILFEFIPGRGLQWVNDDGYFLLGGQNFSYTGSLFNSSTLQPMYLLHGVLMKIGINDYIDFRRIYFIITLVSGVFFLSGIFDRSINNPLIPLAVIPLLSISFTTISYFFQFSLIGLGIYFWTKHLNITVRQVMLMLSGFLLAMQGFLSAGIAVGLLVLVIAMCVIDRNLIKSTFPFSFLGFSLLFWLIYAKTIGFENFFQEPPGHNAELGYFSLRIIKILSINIKILILTSTIFFVSMLINRTKSLLSILLFISFISSICILEAGNLGIYSYKHISDYISIEWAETLISWYREKLGIMDLVLMQLPMVSYLVLLAMFYFYIYDLVIISSGKFELSALVKPSAKTVVISVLATLLIFSSYAVGSNVFLETLMASFSGLFLSLAMILSGLLWRSFNGFHINFFGYVLALFWSGSFFYVGTIMNLPTLNPLLNEQYNEIDSGPLKKIRETSRGIEALNSFYNSYQDLKCDDKIFIPFDYVPLLTYSLQNQHSFDVPIVRPSLFFDGDKITKILNSGKSWCVLDVTTTETSNSLEKRLDPRTLAREMVFKKYKRSESVSSPSIEILDMTLYTND